MTRLLRTIASLTMATAVIVPLSGAAWAVELVGITEITLTWEESAGSVDSYGVYIARDGEDRPAEPTLHVSSNSVTIEAAPSDSLVVWVAAFDANGNHGPISLASDSFEFVIEEPPPTASEGFYFEDFDGYGPGEDPVGWFDVQPKKSPSQADALFRTLGLSDGSTAFATHSTASNIHSHLLIEDSEFWSDYEVAGSMGIDNKKGGIGITLYSEGPSSDYDYRLQSSRNNSFRISSHKNQHVKCMGQTDTGVVPEVGAWYRFRFQAFAVGGGIRIRAKVWRDDRAEPDYWHADCVDSSATFTGGAPGVWASGRGVKIWDDLEVIPLSTTGE